MNKDEVKDVAYVGYLEFEDFLAEKLKKGEPMTPWFKLLKESKLMSWWKHLKDEGNYP